MTNDEPALPGFARVNPNNPYAMLHKLLWPTGPTSSQPADSAAPEPERLARHIDACVADLSLWTDDQDGDATAMDVDDSERPPPAPPIRYINLAEVEHKSLAVHRLLALDMIIVRQEYVDFMAHATAHVMQGKKIHVFLTGQPGIGKSIGAGYFLFRLLASGRSVFFIPDKHSIFYFSEAGVDVVNASHNMGNINVKRALRCSWILIDVESGSQEWFPDPWVELASCLVWTSSPRERRMHHFNKQYKATAWYMKPWSLAEIAAVMTLQKRDPKDIRARFARSGPVARNLFSDPEMVTDTSLDKVINKALADNLFNFATSNLVDQMFLIRPQEVLDEAERPSLQRRECSFEFLSNYIASRTAELTERHVEKVWQQLARAFDNPDTRSAAGKLVESMLHRALIHRKIDLPAAFGGGPVAELELIGKAEDFCLETHAPNRRDCRPLYLRPQTPNFAAVDAILVTVAVLCLFQTSLATSHSHVVKTLLQILTRLEINKIAVDSLRLVYCVVGTDEGRVKRLVREASEKLTTLQASPQARELGNLSQIALTRLNRLRVVGFKFDMQKGLVPLS
ncbi:hypothetical protein DFH08DRAFT_888141 [Mycena albidolilacea]|uniref:Uncharacterized protein n=1 Tax=Mycena albidolilacea TaxID=1033008 RepID=A0AAD6ZGX3_9AGAR|nr:hypothetical protein DFH08DRAFT_888141 [Mycena albidolilacea]